jgi:hypothetical protein
MRKGQEGYRKGRLNNRAISDRHPRDEAKPHHGDADCAKEELIKRQFIETRPYAFILN